MLIIGTNTILYCTRWADTVAFYRDTIGLTTTFENDWFVEFELADGAHVSIADARRTSIQPGGGDGITLSWQVADVTASRDQLTERGVAVSPPMVRWGAATAFLHDPEGNRIEIWTADV